MSLSLNKRLGPSRQIYLAKDCSLSTVKMATFQPIIAQQARLTKDELILHGCKRTLFSVMLASFRLLSLHSWLGWLVHFARLGEKFVSSETSGIQVAFSAWQARATNLLCTAVRIFCLFVFLLSEKFVAGETGNTQAPVTAELAELTNLPCTVGREVCCWWDR